MPAGRRMTWTVAHHPRPDRKARHSYCVRHLDGPRRISPEPRHSQLMIIRGTRAMRWSIILAVLALACGGSADDDGVSPPPPPPPPPTPVASVTISPGPAIELSAGATTQLSAT